MESLYARIDVVCVDDSIEMAETVSDSLESFNPRLNPVATSSPEEVHQAVKEGRVDCIVSDYGMSDTDGLTLLQQIREIDSSVPFILFTSRDINEVKSAIAADASDYQKKQQTPVQFNLLANKIVTHVNANANVELIDKTEEYSDEIADIQERARQGEIDQQRLEIVLNNTPIIMWETDEDGTFTLSRGSGLSKLDLEPGEAVGQNVFDMFANHPTVPNHSRRVLDGEPVSSTIPVGTGVFDVWYEPKWDDSGEVGGMVGLAYDVTDKEKAEEQLIEEREALRKMYRITSSNYLDFEEKVNELLELGRYHFDLDVGMLNGVEGEMARVLNIVGESDLEVDYVRPLTETFCWDTIRMDSVHTVNRSICEPPQRYIGSKIVVGDDEMGTVCFTGSGECRDTNFTEAEKTFIDLMAQWIGHRLAKRRSERRLERQNEALREFANVLSHDLRSPLGVAMGQVESLRQEFDTSDKRVDKITDALNRMNDIIDDVLTLVQSGQAIGEYESVELEKIANMSWNVVRTPGGTLNIENTVEIMGDKSSLHHLFENLFRNAIEHTDGGVTITVGRMSDGFFVEDDGPGIPEDMREKVFEPGHSTGSSGTGLGLAIVNRIATTHGWEVSVKEGSNGGARFEFVGVKSISS